MSIGLADLGLGAVDEYDFFESFHGEFLGKYHKNERFNFTINPAGDVHAFYVESAKPEAFPHRL